MLKHLAVLSFVFFAATTASAVEQFPKNPDDNLTPGALCAHADELRYPEQIKYCERDVSSSTKKGHLSKVRPIRLPYSSNGQTKIQNRSLYPSLYGWS